MNKLIISPLDFLRDSFSLARKVYDSGFVPDTIIALWRGGAPVGAAVHEFFKYKGMNIYNTAIKIESYSGIGIRKEPLIENEAAVLDIARNRRNVLIVDDILDSGSTLKKICGLLDSLSCKVKTSVVYYKQQAGGPVPDYFVRNTDDWVVFPHELMDLTPDELKHKDEFIHKLLVEDIVK